MPAILRGSIATASITKFSTEICYREHPKWGRKNLWRLGSHAHWEPLYFPLEMLFRKYRGNHVWRKSCTPLGSQHNLATLKMLPANDGFRLDTTLEIFKDQQVLQAKTFWFMKFVDTCKVVFADGTVMDVDCHTTDTRLRGRFDEILLTPKRVEKIIFSDLEIVVMEHAPYLHFKIFRSADFSRLEMFLRWVLDYLPKGRYETKLIIRRLH